MHKLAILQIVNVEPNVNADAVERIRVFGWWVGTRDETPKPPMQRVIATRRAVRPQYRLSGD